MVRDVVDIEVHFDKLRLHLEDVLVADVTFNVLSPWSAAEKGWRTHLYRTGSRMFRGKRNLKLEGVNRAWWALSGSKKSTSKRPKAGNAQGGSQHEPPEAGDVQWEASQCEDYLAQ